MESQIIHTFCGAYWLIGRNVCQPFSLAFLDVSKAFDSVSHDSIFLAAATAGIPGPFGRVTSVPCTAGPVTRLRVNGELSQENSYHPGGEDRATR